MRIFIFIFYIVYSIICSAFCISEENINSLKPSLYINPISSLYFLHVGLSSTEFILDAGDVARIEALDRDWSAPIECTRGPPDPINARALITSIITVGIRS